MVQTSKKVPEKEYELNRLSMSPLLGPAGLKSQPSPIETPQVLSGHSMKYSQVWGKASKHVQHLHLPSKDGVLLIQVSTGAKRDEAGGEDMEVREGGSRSFLLPVSAKATQLSPCRKPRV